MSNSVEEVKKAAHDEGWIAGVAYAAQILGRWGETSHAAEVIAQSGLGYNDFDRCDDYDRKEVRRLFRTEPTLREKYEARKRR